jgi:5'-3' exonuclease
MEMRDVRVLEPRRLPLVPAVQGLPGEGLMDEKVLLVDGDNILIRAVKAVEYGRSSMTAADGTPTGPLLIFINSLSRYVSEVKPDRMVICWDHGPCLWRRALYSGYKASRSYVADVVDPVGQEPELKTISRALAREYCTFAGLSHVDRAGWEADDLIGAYWRLHNQALWDRVTILSNDKDFMQLLDAPTRQVRVSSADTPTDVWDEFRVVTERGCTPEQIPSVMALTGDTSDGVPGVRGIGPKTAVKLLKQAGWDLDLIDSPRVAQERSAVRTYRRLVDLRTPPVDHNGFSLDVAPVSPFRPTLPGDVMYVHLTAFLERLGMNSVVERIQQATLWR